MKQKPKGPRPRLVRDPIHGDVRVSALEAAVIDTRAFQRLRYIRQNALLHFVFPGAVHTRFGHSIGTMSVAGRTFDHLVGAWDFQPVDRSSFRYLRTVFRLAALLHDVGHCAFSHSSERVEVDGDPLLGTLRERLIAWREAELVAQLVQAGSENIDKAAMHEELGWALVRFLFRKEKVQELCASELGAPAESVAQDVCAILSGLLPESNAWAEHSSVLFQVYSRTYKSDTASTLGRAKKAGFSQGLLGILHGLISGTADVDRMDYLLRDSYYIGVPYGRCDIDVLIANLRIGCVKGELELLLSRKAVDALDDLLWSRYQLFVQVLNHKANVALNTMLSTAISDAIGDALLDRPATLEEYLLFTDDHVMAVIRQACSKGRLDAKPYAKTLVDRRLPMHLGSADDPETKAGRKTLLQGKASASRVPIESIFTGTAESFLIKPGYFPYVIDYNRAQQQYDIHSFDEYSLFFKKGVPPVRRVLHYYVDRDSV